MTSQAILGAIGQLGGRAAPPAIRRVLRLPEPNLRYSDELAGALEQLRQDGKLAVQWSDLGNAQYRLVEGR